MSDSDNLKKILEDSFRDLFNRDNTARKLYGKIKQNKATYKDAQLFARRVGELAANAFRDSTSPDMFPALDNQQALIESVLGLLRVDHEIVSEATAVVQKTINTRAGLGLNAVVPNMDVDRAEGIARNIADQEDKDAAVDRMNTMADNYSQHVVDESIRQNANFQWKSGMSPKIVRTAEARSCKWCRELAGTYEYSEVSDTGNDVFRRHENCNCTVEFVADGKHAQDVWSKASYRYKDSADRVRSHRAIEDYREALQQEQQERRIARSKDIERVQRELGYSSKGAAIWYNKNKEAIEQNGLDYMLATLHGKSDLALNSSGIAGTKLPPLSSRGISLPEKLTNILDKTPDTGSYCVVSELTNNELRTLTQETGVEYAKITISEDVYVIRGKEKGIVIPNSFVDEMKAQNGRLDAHCHPFIGDVIPSEADLEALTLLEKETGQSTSEIISVDGMRSIYSKYGIISVETVTDNSTLSEERKMDFLRLFGGE
ncbi:MAG: hypothetical protein IJ201_00225 [Solobacterium sp.]|nr:hypothetical protein [Solobacterium sp.]